MGTGDDDEGGRRRGGKEGGRASGRATTVAVAPIANEVLVANLSKIADKQCTAPVVVAPPASSSLTILPAGSAPSDSPGTTPSSSSSAVVINGNYYNDDDDDGLGGRTMDKVGEREGKEEDRNLLLTWLLQEGYRINSPSVARATEVDCEEMGKPSGQGLDEDGVVGKQDCGGTRGRGRCRCQHSSSDATSRAIPPSTVIPAIVCDNYPPRQGIEERRVRPPKQQ